MQVERRKNERFNVSLAASYKRKCGEVVAASLENLSIEGCFVKTEQPIKMGEQINLVIALPDSRLLNLTGRVMYHRPLDGFGVLFSSPGDTERAVLDELIDSLLAKSEVQSSNVWNPALEQYINQSEAIS